MAGKPIHAVLAFAVALALLLNAVPARAEMSILDEDRLSDVQCKAGLSLIVKMRTTGGTYRITSTGYLEIQNWTINNGSTGFAQIGTPASPAKLDWTSDFNATGQPFIRLVLPNTMSDTTPPSGQADLYMQNGYTGAVLDLGNLEINRIYNNQSRWTLGADGANTGFRGAFEFHMDVDEIRIYKGNNYYGNPSPWLAGHDGGAGVTLEDSWMYGLPNSFGTNSGLPSPFTGQTHAPTNPNDTLMYCSFGLMSGYPMQVNLYTIAMAPTGSYSTGNAAFYDTRMRISYVVQGTYRVQNTHIGPSSNSTTNGWSGSRNYGPILMDNFHCPGNSGGIVIELPVTSSFYPDSVHNT